MSELTWYPIFHFYQPPTQTLQITRKVLEQSYLPFLAFLVDNPSVRLTLNITSSLTDQINQIGDEDFFRLIKTLTSRNQIDLLLSPYYHPLLPITPLEVGLRQIRYAQESLEHFYETQVTPVLLPPELAISEELIDILGQENDLQATLVDESSVNSNFSIGNISAQTVSRYRNLKLIMVSRTITEVIRAYPNPIPVEAFKNLLMKLADTNPNLVSVNDVELFGHHYGHRTEFFHQILSDPLCQISPLSELLQKNEHSDDLNEIQSSTWETTQVDLNEGNFFPLWSNPTNELQRDYLELIDQCWKLLQSSPNPKEDVNLNFSSAQKHFDQGVSSCHLYWLSNKPWWNPGLVENGAFHLVRSSRSLPGNNTLKQQIEHQYASLISKIWTYHWSEKPQLGYNQFDHDRVNRIEEIERLL